MQFESSKVRVFKFRLQAGGRDDGRITALMLQSDHKPEGDEYFFYFVFVPEKILRLKLKETVYLRNPLENYPLLVDSLKLFHQLYLKTARSVCLIASTIFSR